MLVTIPGFTVTNYRDNITNLTLRVFASDDFLDFSQVILYKKGISPAQGFYFEFTCTVNLTAKTITLPVIQLPSTTDSSFPAASYSSAFYNKDTLVLGFIEYFRLLGISSQTWPQIFLANDNRQPRPLATQYYTKEEVDFLITQATQSNVPGGIMPVSQGGTGADLSTSPAGFLKKPSGGNTPLIVGNIQTTDLTGLLTARQSTLSISGAYTILEFPPELPLSFPFPGTARVNMGNLPIGNTTGILPTSRGGLNNSITPLDGHVLIGNAGQSRFDAAFLAFPGNNLNAVLSPGALSLNTAQGIKTSDSPVFNGLTINTANINGGPLNLQAGLSSTGKLHLNAIGNVNRVALSAPDSLTGNYDLKLPASPPPGPNFVVVFDALGNSTFASFTAMAGGYTTISEEGVSLPARSVLNFIGNAITASDDGMRTNITLSVTPAASPQLVGSSRNIASGTGLTGGGSLANDLTISVLPDTTLQRINVRNLGDASPTPPQGRPGLVFEGTGAVSISLADDPGNNATRVTINAATGSGGGVTGNGTVGKLAKFLTPTAITDSLLSESISGIILATSAGQPSSFNFTNATNSIGLRAPAGLASNFNITLPDSLPTATEFLKLSNSGQLVTGTAVESFVLSSGGTTISLAGTNNLTLSIPDASPSALRGIVTNSSQVFGGAKTFTSTVSIQSATSPTLLLNDTTNTAALTINSNALNLRSSSSSAGNGLNINLSTNRVGINTASAVSDLHVVGTFGIERAANGSIFQLTPSALTASSTYTLPNAADGFLRNTGGILSFNEAITAITNNANTVFPSRSTVRFVGSGGNNVSVVDTGTVLEVNIAGSGAGSSTSISTIDNPLVVTSPSANSFVLSPVDYTSTPDTLIVPDLQGSISSAGNGSVLGSGLVSTLNLRAFLFVNKDLRSFSSALLLTGAGTNTAHSCGIAIYDATTGLLVRATSAIAITAAVNAIATGTFTNNNTTTANSVKLVPGKRYIAAFSQSTPTSTTTLEAMSFQQALKQFVLSTGAGLLGTAVLTSAFITTQAQGAALNWPASIAFNADSTLTANSRFPLILFK